MKKIRRRLLELNIFAWSSGLLLVIGIYFIRVMRDATSALEIKPSLILGYIILIVIYALLSIVWIIGSRKTYRGDNFLSSSVVILDEDERGLSIHHKSKEKASSWVQNITVFVFITLITTYSLDIQLEFIFIYVCLMLTVHSLVYYLYVKKLYYN